MTNQQIVETAFTDWWRELGTIPTSLDCFRAGWDAADAAAEVIPPNKNPDGTHRLRDLNELKAENRERVRRSTAGVVGQRMAEEAAQQRQQEPSTP